MGTNAGRRVDTVGVRRSLPLIVQFSQERRKQGYLSGKSKNGRYLVDS